MTHVRHLRPGENWPDSLWMGFDGPLLDREWCWVVEDNDHIAGGLLTCPMHGSLFLLRLATATGAPSIAIRTLLRSALEESRAKGITGWVTLIDPTTAEGRRLQRIIKTVGGLQWPRPTIMAFGLMAHAGEKL